MKFLCCVLFLTVGAVVKAQQDYVFPDYWQGDYDGFYDSLYNDAADSNEETALKQAETIKADDIELQDVQPKTEPREPEDKQLDVMEDYQIEDNRSNSGEKEAAEEHKDITADNPKPDEAEKNVNDEDLAVRPLEKDEQSDESNFGVIVDYDVPVAGFVYAREDTSPPVPITEENKDILEETKDTSSEDFGKFYDQPVEQPAVEFESPGKNDEEFDIDKIIEETSKLLEESDNSFEPLNEYENSDETQEQEKSKEVSENNHEIDEDTPEKVYADLDADIEKLFATLDKLSDDSSDESEATNEQKTNEDNVQDYEEKYGKPYKEDVALSWRAAETDDAEANEQDKNVEENNDKAAEENLVSDEEYSDGYDTVDDSNLSYIFEEFNDAKQEEKELNESNENVELKSVTTEKNNEPIEEEMVSSDKNETVANPVEKLDSSLVFDYIENFGEPVNSAPNPDDDIHTMIEKILSEDAKEPQSYGNDALVDEKQTKDKDAVEFESVEASNKVLDDIEAKALEFESAEATTKISDNTEEKTVMVDDLSSAELSELMTQFAAAHSEDLDVNSETFARHIAPIHITLSVDEPTIITSPNYPSPYPNNNIVDWILEGPGTGIELNITDFAVNGAIGDYLLVKPGGLDESGTEGLIFSYRLHSERRYRFSDVNKMFVRFESKPGWQFLTGFSFSVKMMWPLPELADEVPEPEPIIQPPQETLTLNLAGVTVPRFNEIKQDFLELVADMAKAYIRDNEIDGGSNTTLEVTQITRTAVCNIHWPNYETCVEVTFGVPLQYDEDSEPRLNAEELDDMWTTYIIKDQFAARLQSLGITEYAIPNDSMVLMVWLVIAAGVLISMAMLAFALWRFSCFEDYTRMQAYGDADSLQNEKRNLDLYPTPHQTLPPLYTENDYKWADDKYDDSTRVDMGGFANKSYVRDELFDLESDEDVITTRDRKGVISPRDFSDV